MWMSVSGIYCDGITAFSCTGGQFLDALGCTNACEEPIGCCGGIGELCCGMGDCSWGLRCSEALCAPPCGEFGEPCCPTETGGDPCSASLSCCVGAYGYECMDANGC
jgi:hypothetical protein